MTHLHEYSAELDDPIYREGFRARLALQPLSSCPYPEGDVRLASWCEGYFDAAGEAQPGGEKP